MSKIKLSQIKDECFDDNLIQTIVYSDIEDDGLNAEYALVFGNSLLMKERVSTALDIYHMN